MRSKYAVTDLFRDVAAKVADRPGGYTRIIKVGNRLGDNADMAMIELVDFNELYNGGKKEVKKAKSRRGGKAKKADEVTEQAPVAASEAPAVAEVEDSSASEQVEETPVVEVEEVTVAEVEATSEEVIDEAPTADSEDETPTEDKV